MSKDKRKIKVKLPSGEKKEFSFSRDAISRQVHEKYLKLGYKSDDFKGIHLKKLNDSNVPALFSKYLSELKVSKKYLNAEQKHELDVAIIHDFNSWMYKKFHVQNYQDYIATESEKTGIDIKGTSDLMMSVQLLLYRRVKRFLSELK